MSESERETIYDKCFQKRDQIKEYNKEFDYMYSGFWPFQGDDRSSVILVMKAAEPLWSIIYDELGDVLACWKMPYEPASVMPGITKAEKTKMITTDLKMTEKKSNCDIKP